MESKAALHCCRLSTFVSRSSTFPTHDRIEPAARRRDCRCLCGSPAAWLVGMDHSGRSEHGIDDAPRFLHVVLACKKRPISDQGIAQHALIGIALVRPGVTAGEELYRPADARLI